MWVYLTTGPQNLISWYVTSLFQGPTALSTRPHMGVNYYNIDIKVTKLPDRSGSIRTLRFPGLDTQLSSLLESTESSSPCPRFSEDLAPSILLLLLLYYRSVKLALTILLQNVFVKRDTGLIFCCGIRVLD